MHWKVEPGPVAIFQIGRWVMRYPQKVLSPVVTFLDLCKIATAKVTVKGDGHAMTFLELLSDSLRMHRFKMLLLRLR